ncbi:MAG: aromatic ring-hydroxylating oxygenase subunit alpha [Alphaproteobacteria bacterium]
MATPAALAARCYTDPAIHAAERRTIFAANWALFGPEHEVAAPGSWAASSINGWPMVVVRDGAGVLRAFHNVCRHRGAAIVADGTGTATQLRCPYHGWTYGLDGHLALAPRFGDGELDRAAHGLLPVMVATWRGLVFVRVAPEGDSLAAWLGAIPGLVEPFPTAGFDYHGVFTAEGDANWKTYCDNTVEGYHLPHIHPRLSQAVDPARITIRPYDGGRCVAFHVAYRADGSDLRGRDGVWFYRFPGFQATISANAFKAERIEPLGPGRLRSVSWQWFRGLDARSRAEAFAWARTIVEEDLAVCAGVQRNLAAGVFDRAVLSAAVESNVALFQGLVRVALGDAIQD